MSHFLSDDDQLFRRKFEAGGISPSTFNHRAHLRLAYIYLVELDTDAAYLRMQRTLTNFLNLHEIDPEKFHHTMTFAWILAVRHFMEKTPSAASADAFIDQHPMMLDTRIMMTHYSHERMFSAEARAKFVEPDLDPIPRYGRQT